MLDSSSAATPGDRLLLDAQAVIGRAIETHAHLLTAGERVVARRLLALSGPPGRAWARLVGRRRALFRPRTLRWEDVPDPGAAVAALERAGLVHGGIPWDARLPLFTAPELRGACRALGLPAGGRRRDLEARLRGRRGWSDEPVRRVGYRALLRRLELLAFASPGRDRSALLLARLGIWRWPEYTPTGGPPLFVDRGAMLDLEEAMASPAASAPEELLEQVLAAAPRPPWMRQLDPRRWRARGIFEAARALERAGELSRARGLYEGLLASGALRPGPVAWRLALVLGRLGQPAEGAAVCEGWRDRAAPAQRPALERTGRRLAKQAGRAWRPARPLLAPPRRSLLLRQSPKRGSRPRWGPAGLTVEDAVIQALPRPALHGENGLWTTLFGLVMSPLYWAPVPGMLPARCMTGPLDLGTPSFAEHRREAFEQTLARVAAGEAPALLRAAWERHRGERVRGIRWELAGLELLLAAAEGLGGAVLEAVLRRLGEEGWGAARGLPDLLILPGEPVHLGDAVPGGVGPEALLVELKGPTDALRDAQAVWLDRLLRAGARVELWSIQPAPGGAVGLAGGERA